MLRLVIFISVDFSCLVAISVFSFFLLCLVRGFHIEELFLLIPGGLIDRDHCRFALATISMASETVFSH